MRSFNFFTISILSLTLLKKVFPFVFREYVFNYRTHTYNTSIKNIIKYYKKKKNKNVKWVK